MKISFILFFVLFFLGSDRFALSSDEIKAECGGHARIVWCQDAGDGSDAGAEGRNLRLMGLDTEDNKGERCILTNLSNYAKPMLAPDGEKIVFSNRQEQKIYIVGFDGSNLKALAPGFALAVWRDPLTEKEWIYAGTITNQADSVIVNIRRFRSDKPEVSEPVWGKTHVNIDNFQLSADGKYACGVFPWPSCGMAMLPDREWKKYGDGCWPSLAPDDSLLMWIFDGAHRNLTFFRTKTGERWVVNINNAPGIDGFEVYHPRWSNHPLFMVMTGPYKLGEGNNRIRGGGRDVEIYLGKFSPDYKKIEKWIQVTRNQYADFFPDAWIAKGRAGLLVRLPEDQQNGATGCRALPCGIITEEQVESKNGVVDVSWPVSFEGLVFFWQNRSKANTFTDPVAKLTFVCRVDAKGRARYGRHFEMAPSGGAFIADGGAGELINACTASGQLAIEAMILPGAMDFKKVGRGVPVEPSGRTAHPEGSPCLGNIYRLCWRHDFNSTGDTNLLPIIGYAAESGCWNFLLGQQGRELVFRLRAAKGGPDYVIPFGILAGNEPSHVVISCSSSSVVYYLNGEQIFSKDSVYGGNWTLASSVEPQGGKIVFGNELRKEYAVNTENEKTGWGGLIENAALYSRWIGPEEAREKYKASVEKIRGRKQLPVLSVKAKLISMPAVPSPASIAPYRRALTVGHYQIEEVTPASTRGAEGTCSNLEVMVAQWAILDGQILNSAQGRKGEIYNLKLEPFSDHPELEGERLIMDSERFDLPVYYEIEGR